MILQVQTQNNLLVKLSGKLYIIYFEFKYIFKINVTRANNLSVVIFLKNLKRNDSVYKYKNAFFALLCVSIEKGFFQENLKV